MAHAAALQNEAVQRNLAFIYGRDQTAVQHDPDKRVFVKSRPKFVDNDVITRFDGGNAFLAPDFPCSVCLTEAFPSIEIYPSFEHALQASKVEDPNLRQQIRTATDIREVKRLVSGKQKDGWKERCIRIGEILLRDKFVRNKSIQQKLAETRSGLIYVNSYGDKFWGVTDTADNSGANNLGKLLERIRDDVRNKSIVEKWLKDSFQVVPADQITIAVRVSKDNEIIAADCKTFSMKSMLYMGKSDESDLIAEHPSVSRTNSVFVVDSKVGNVIVDLGSSNGTYLNDCEVSPFTFVAIQSSSGIIRCGASRRCYQFTVDYRASQQRQESLISRIVNPLDSGAGCQDHETNRDTTIFVRNIPPEATEADVHQMFVPCGNIVRFAFPTDKSTGKHRGIAFISFETLSGFMQGMSRDGDELAGAIIRVKRNDFNAKAKPNGSDAGASSRGPQLPDRLNYSKDDREYRRVDDARNSRSSRRSRSRSSDNRDHRDRNRDSNSRRSDSRDWRDDRARRSRHGH